MALVVGSPITVKRADGSTYIDTVTAIKTVDSATVAVTYALSGTRTVTQTPAVPIVQPTPVVTLGKVDVTPTPPPAGTTTTGSSGSSVSSFAMPTSSVSNANGNWTYLRGENFNTNVALGSWPNTSTYPYWGVYGSGPDTYGQATYNPAQTTWVANGMLQSRMYTDGNGQRKAFANLFSTTTGSQGLGGQLYGRYSVCVKAINNNPNYDGTEFGIAFLLWPVSGNWPTDGEIDWPETDLQTGSWGSAYMHYANSGGGQDGFTANRGDTIRDWHVYTTEWGPGRVEFFIDGTSIGASTTQVPAKPMRWSLQGGATVEGTTPNAAADLTVQVDWAAMWSRS